MLITEHSGSIDGLHHKITVIRSGVVFSVCEQNNQAVEMHILPDEMPRPIEVMLMYISILITYN